MAKTIKTNYQYWRITDERQEWLGLRYFRFNHIEESTLQICFGTGKDMKKGRANNVGIYLIHKVTFFTNYLAMGYCIPIRKAEFDKKFIEITKALQ